MKKYINLKNLTLFLIFTAIVSILFFDNSISLLILRINSKNTDKFWKIITDSVKIIPIVIIAIDFLFLFSLINSNIKEEIDHYRSKLSGIFYGLNAAIFINYAVKFSKYFFGRVRPFYLKYTGNINRTFLFFKKFDAFASFPSGHSATAWAFAVFVVMLFEIKNKKALTLIYGYATMVSLSRMFLSMHYLSDIIVGGFIGFYCMKYIFLFLKEKNILN